MDKSDIILFVAGSRMGSQFDRKDLKDLQNLFPGNLLYDLKIDHDYELLFHYGMLKYPSCSRSFFRNRLFVQSLPKSYKAMYEPENDEAAKKLESLKKYARTVKKSPSLSPFQEYTCQFSRIENNMAKMEGLNEFSEQVVTDLMVLIPEVLKKPNEGPFENSTSMRSVYKFDDILMKCNDSLAIIGGPGSGKSSMMRYIAECQSRDYFVIKIDEHTPLYAAKIITQFCSKMFTYLFNEETAIVDYPHDMDGLLEQFLLLSYAIISKGKKLLFIVDDFDEIENSDNIWVPKFLEMKSIVRGMVVWIFGISDERSLGTIRKSIPHIKCYKMSQDNQALLGYARQKPHLRNSLMQLFEHIETKTIFHINLLEKVMEYIINDKSSIQIKMIETTSLKLLGMFLGILEAQLYIGPFVRPIFSLLCISNGGLLEKDLVEIMGFTVRQWNLIFSELKFLIVLRQGKLEPYHDELKTIVFQKYLETSEKKSFWYLRLSNYILSKKTLKLTTLTDSQANEIVNCGYYLYKTGKKKFIEVVATLTYISSAYFCGKDYEVEKMLSSCLKMAVALNDRKLVRLAREYLSFNQKYGLLLSTYPLLATSIGRNVLVENIKNEAYLVSIPGSLYLKENQLTQRKNINFSPMGSHDSKIIYITVLITKIVGKCCLTVSEDGTIIAWDIDTGLFSKRILNKPLKTRKVKFCCFSLKGAEFCSMSCQNGEIFNFELISRRAVKVSQPTLCGPLLSSGDIHDIWIKSVTTDNAKKPVNCLGKVIFSKNDDKSQVRFQGLCDEIIGKSLDGQKCIILALKICSVIIFNTSILKEICRFEDKNVGKTSVGAFSNSKDLVAISREDENIMIWKLDNHSRTSLIKTNGALGKVNSICFDSGEINIFYIQRREKESSFHIANINTGHCVYTDTSFNGHLMDEICCSTSNGEERIFTIRDNKVFSCTYEISEISESRPNRSRHTNSVSKVVLLQKKAGLASVSNEGINIWNAELVFVKQLIPQNMQEGKLTFSELGSLKYDIFEKANVFSVLSGEVLYIFDLVTGKEFFRITHFYPVKQALFYPFITNKYFLIIYTLTTENILRGWKSTFYTDEIQRCTVVRNYLKSLTCQHSQSAKQGLHTM